MSYCHCGSTTSFEQCCQPLLNGKAFAPTAEALMRSRYSAFVTGAVDYLLQTSASESHEPDERALLENSCKNTRWLALHVLDTEHGSEIDGKGIVEFAAFFQTGGSPEQLHERSAFEKRDGQWIYVSGEFLAPLSFGRNDPCWCRSGKKHKKCHGRS
ncbi:YchJ family protein [Litorivivens sp.]|uniref:YchJ family protein n=1 Tax=Litorivivens sp. TaxID=2020868 RepID=UPI00356B506D